MMAEQMLKQAGAPSIKPTDEFIDLKKINNQPLDPEMERKHLDSYLHFSPLGEEDGATPGTPTVKFPGNKILSSDDDRFQIQNLAENDSDNESMNEEEGISHSPPGDNVNIHLHEHAYVKTPPIAQPSDGINEHAENDVRRSEFKVEQNDTESISEAEDKQKHSEENKAGKENLLMETPNGDLESGVTQNVDRLEQPSKLGKDLNQMENGLGKKDSVKSDMISHEMECQTEDISDDNEDLDGNDGVLSTVKADQSNDTIVTPEPPEEKISVERLKDTRTGSDLEDETLTMICESITKETFSTDNGGNNSVKDVNNDDDEDDEDYDEYTESRAKKKKRKSLTVKTVNPMAGSEIEWKEAYGSTRDLDGDPEALKMPFEKGWKRELVIRGVYEEYSKTGQPKRKPADVYYFTPDGRKLRSKIMIANYITETGSTLTQENFSFIRRPIHKPPQEMVRQAGKSKGRKSFPTPAKSLSPFKSSPSLTPSTSPRQRGKKRKRVGRPRKFSLSDSLTQSEAPQQLPVISTVPPPEVVLEREGQEEPYEKKKTLPNEVMVHPNSTQSPMMTFPPPRKSKPTARKSTTQAAKRHNQPPPTEIPTQNYSRLNSGQLCGLNCPGRGGNSPSLQCGVCMCLFHPECVNAPLSQQQNFVCLRCKSFSPKSTSATVSKASVSSSMASLPQSTPMLRSCLSGQVVPQTLLTTSGDASLNNMKILIPVPPPPGVHLSNSSQSQVNNPLAPVTLIRSDISMVPISGSPITFIPQTGTQAFNTTTVSQSLMSSLPVATIAPPKLTPAPSRPSSGAYSAETQLINRDEESIVLANNSVINVTNATLVTKPGSGSNKGGGESAISSPQQGRSTPAQLLTLPAAVSKRLNMTQPLALRINNKQILAPPSCFLRSGDTIKVCLPPNTVPVSGGQLSFDMQVKVNGENISNSISVLSIDGANSVLNGTPENIQKYSKNSYKGNKRNKKLCHFHKLWSGFEAMLQIFSHLNPKDLLRARCVCRAWNKLVTQTSLWQNVALRDIHVNNWEKAVKFLKKFDTESLDFQRYHEVPEDVFPALGRLSLSRLELGEVTPSFLHSVGKHLPSLVHLTAKVKGERGSFVDFGQMSDLTELQELRLYPSDYNGVDDTRTKGQKLADLVTLTQLECLILTGIKEIDENDWRFLGETTKLRQLEVSSCASWNSSTFFLLGQCIELEVLRLSNGGVLPDIGLADALVNLTKLKHLSLEKWAIPHSLQDVLSELEVLETLSISPDSNAQRCISGSVQTNLKMTGHPVDMINLRDRSSSDSKTQSAVINRNTLSAVWDLSQLKSLRWGINNSQDSTIILNDGAGDEDSTIILNDGTGTAAPPSKSDPISSQTTQCIPFLSDDVESDDISDLDIQQMTQFISIDQLREKLQSLLPNSNIDVYVLSNNPGESITPQKSLMDSNRNSSPDTSPKCTKTWDS